jgi:uncharacterized protein (TIGR02145 family)
MKKFFFSTMTLILGLVLSGAGCNTDPDPVPDPEGGVTINGVVWATCNVNSPGYFVANPGDPGMFYQWNRKSVWYYDAGDVTAIWDDSYPPTTWNPMNDPCPTGWHTPTIVEFQKLIDDTKVSFKMDTRNGLDGMLFTDISTNKSVFFPCGGARVDAILGGRGLIAGYWSSVSMGGNKAFLLGVGIGFGMEEEDTKKFACSIRCVKD